MQIETNPNNKIVVKTSIEWKSEYEYIMTYSEILNHPKDVCGVIGKKIYCVINIVGNTIKINQPEKSSPSVPAWA
jgi:hypothetical protein